VVRGRIRLLVLVAGASALVVGVAGAATGFDTGRPAQVVAVEPGVVIDPILSTGDVVGGYQMTGIPDGLGAYISSGDDEADSEGNDDGDKGGSGDNGDNGGSRTIQLFMNHELDGTSPAGVSARVSQVTLDAKTRTVLSAKYVLTGVEGFLRFCSGTLDFIQGKPMYFTGEESAGGHGGSSIAVDAVTGTWRETRHFGLLQHENVVPVKRLSQAMFVTSEDGTAGKNQLYAYIAPTFEGAISGTQGSLYVWKADAAAADGNPSTNDIQKGQTLTGRFVPVTQAENANAATLEAAAQAKNAFDFTRLEDIAVAKGRPGHIYFDDTGALGQETVRGRLYRMDIDRSDPTRASITLLLDGDKLDNLVNPDNLGTSRRSVVIQEDRNAEHRVDAPPFGGYSRVLVYDIASGNVRYVARVNTPAGLPPGEWETSGVINAFELLGKNWWLLDNQGHAVTAPQPGPTLAPNSGVGEDGQLLAVKIPNS
jgi:hypothetical protein